MYTKGKWRVERADLTIRSDDFENGTQMGDYRGVIVADLKPALGCDVSISLRAEYLGRKRALPQTLANAQLIASAPKLLQICKEASGWLSLDEHVTAKHLATKIDKIVAKAEGIL